MQTQVGHFQKSERGLLPKITGFCGSRSALLPQMKADILLADKAFDADERVIEPLLAAGRIGICQPD